MLRLEPAYFAVVLSMKILTKLSTDEEEAIWMFSWCDNLDSEVAIGISLSFSVKAGNCLLKMMPHYHIETRAIMS
jgi:hypothetical protein